MSITITKAGVLDTIQDVGRFGYQYYGINPGGAMDFFSSQLANALLGKDLNDAVIELHFPAAEILFQHPTVICLTGADFTAVINEKEIPINQPVAILKNSLLKFMAIKSGARCYLSTNYSFEVDKWLNSYSTNIKVCSGGYKGRSLKKGDEIKLNKTKSLFTPKEFSVLPWKVFNRKKLRNEIKFITGAEWDWLSTEIQDFFLGNIFHLTAASDRMGFKLEGENLKLKNKSQLLSSPVAAGTIQLLPNGQLIILMADHQTIGGYPRIANIISSDISQLAQMHPNEKIKFKKVNQVMAEESYLEQQNYLLNIQKECKLKMQVL